MSIRKGNALVICFFLLTARAALGKDTLGGQVFANSFIPINTGQTGQQTGGALQNEGALWLDGEYDFNKITAAHATLTAAEVNPGITPDATGFHGDVREAYIDSFYKGFGFKMGRQIISWGKSDGVNPTDYFSGFDYTIFNPDQEYQRLATDAIQFNFSPNRGRSHFNFTAVLVAHPPRTKILPAGTTHNGEFANVGDAHPDTPFDYPEAGLKIAYTGRSWDASISAFAGRNHTPNFDAVNFTTTPRSSLAVEQYYQPIAAFGGDFSVALGDWVLRGESSYTWIIGTDPTVDPSVLPEHFDAVLGIERPLGDFFRVGVQGIYRYIPNWRDPATAKALGDFPEALMQQVAIANQLVEGDQNPTEFGQSLRVEFDHPASGFNIQLFLLHYEYRKDTLFRPMLTYHWTGDFKTYIGVNDFSGPVMSPFGAYSVYNAWFAGGIYTF